MLLSRHERFSWILQSSSLLSMLGLKLIHVSKHFTSHRSNFGQGHVYTLILNISKYIRPRVCHSISVYCQFSSVIHTPSLQWRYNGCDGVSNHQPHGCLLNCLFRRRSKKTSKLHVTGLCAGNSPVTGEFPAQMASNAENVSIWWTRCIVIFHLPIRVYNV